MMEMRIIVILAAIFGISRNAEGSSEPWLQMTKVLNSDVRLPCELKLAECENFHSIKWYRGHERIHVHSAKATNNSHGSNESNTRLEFIRDQENNMTHLRIPNVGLDDEGVYRCEVTYYAVKNVCIGDQHVNLTVIVVPKEVIVTNNGTNERLIDGQTLGPVNEGTTIVLDCKSGEGKPVPVIKWFNGTQLLEVESKTEVAGNMTGTASSRLEVTVSRGDLRAEFTCKATSPMWDPVSSRVILDVNLPPLQINLTKEKNRVSWGTIVLLTCVVSGAKPNATVTWYNDTNIMNYDDEEIETMIATSIKTFDGTYETTAYLSFNASEYDNNRSFICKAGNNVSKPIEEKMILEVLYPPIITISQDNITVNETESIELMCDYRANPSTLNNVIWMRYGHELDPTEGHYSIENTTLMIKNATRDDDGIYTCLLGNDAGTSTSADGINVSILYKPEVNVTMDPPTPVNEADRQNVSLTCNVTSGNPSTLTAVRWYLDGDLLKELPDCSRNTTPATNEDASTFCDIDPSKLLLEAVGRSFHGNYSCEGRNDAGWGPVSEISSVIVHYKPGPATISYEPQKVVKNGNLVITCSVLDPGRPEVIGYKWIRGVHQMSKENNTVLQISPVNLVAEDNFTCMAYNAAGEGDSASTFIDVLAPPAFINKQPAHQGFVYNATNVSLECWVECEPICNISWYKNESPIDFANDKRFQVQNEHLPPNSTTSDFESMRSTLKWNMLAWENGELNRYTDNSNFTCKSDDNSIGPGVKNVMIFQVQYPPVKMSVSHTRIDVLEGLSPQPVTCSAEAQPEPSFTWYREDTNRSITDLSISSSTLALEKEFNRRSSGNYICVASNTYGKSNITVYMNVTFKPECEIKRIFLDGKDSLCCSAVANPNIVNYTWTLKNDNDTLDQGPEEKDGKSCIFLGNVAIERTYECIVTNSIGPSKPCVFAVEGLPWWYRHLKIVVIVAAVIILAIFIICIVLFIICRRKRDQAKYNNRVVELEEREHPDGGPPSPSASSHSTQIVAHPTPAPRWPLKPGVLVHVNRTHSLRSGLSNRSDLPARTPTTRSDRSQAEGKITRTPVRAYRRARDAQRAMSMSNVHDEGMLARAHRIRAMFGAQLKDPDNFPGISRDKTAVTYKRIAPRQRTSYNAPPPPPGHNTKGISRKRKKPGADPTEVANNNHVDSVSEGLPEPETKTFYENLPFHGIQTPQNKLVSPKFARVTALHGSLHSATPSPSSSRPASRSASLCGGSSGYGSTRSHLGPHYSAHNMPRSNSPELKYNSLKPRRRKLKHTQFYSLRLCHRHRSTHQNYQLYAIPIRKSCPHKSDSSSTIATTVRSAQGTPTGTPTPTSSPPKPAPRKKKSDPSQHIYQNVPTPVFPQSADTTKIKTNNLYNYREHYQQRQQELQQYGYPVASSSSSQLTLPLTRSLHHSSAVSPLQTSFSSQTNNHHSLPRHEGSTMQQSLGHGTMEMDLTHDHPTRNHSGGGGGGRRRERRKNRKHGNDRKSKQRWSEPRRPDPPYAFAHETSFNQVQEQPRENSKISYPHYYEDSITECPTDYLPPKNTYHRDRDAANRYSNSSLHYADLNLGDKSRSKGKRHTTAPRESRPPSAPPATQYAELQFRDVGQEIDV